MLTLKTYAHAIREEEAGLLFADLETEDGPGRPLTSMRTPPKKTPPTTGRGHLDFLEHETGLEPANPHVGKEMLGLISLRFFG